MMLFLSLKIALILTNSADSGEMPPCHLRLHCFPKLLFTGIKNEKEKLKVCWWLRLVLLLFFHCLLFVLCLALVKTYVLSLLMFCGSSSRSRGLVCRV